MPVVVAGAGVVVAGVVVSSALTSVVVSVGAAGAVSTTTGVAGGASCAGASVFEQATRAASNTEIILFYSFLFTFLYIET